MTWSGGPPSIGGTRENPAQPGNMFSHLLTHAPATAGAWISSRVPPSASSVHLGPFGGGPSRVVLPTMGVSPARSSQLVGPLTGHAMQVQSNNDVTCDLLQRNCVPASLAMLPPRNGVSESSAMLARSNDRFSFQSPQPHYAAPNDDINSRVLAQIHPNYYPASIMMNRPSVPCQPPCTGTSRSFSQFLARPRQEVPIQFSMEHGVLNGPILVASNPLTDSSLTDSSVLEALGSSQAQSVGLHNVVRSARRGALTREAGSRFVQEREPIGRNNELAFLMGTRSVSRRELIHELAFFTDTRSLQLTELTCFEVRCLHMGAHLAGTRPMQQTELVGFSYGRLHGHRLLAGTGSVRPTVPGFNIGLFHGHTPHRGPRPVSRRQPMGLFASTARGDERATAAATNGPMVWRVTRMVRIEQTTTRARADILAAARGRGRQGGANQDLSNWTNQ